MLKLPGHLTAEKFLSDYWQEEPLFMPQAIDALRPSVTRNELAWLATLDDVESRIVVTDRGDEQTRYRVETGPFDTAFLAALPKRDWTLLVHDVEKHLPAMRRLFAWVPFIPDWRIDDLMISFAAPGGGVGPHRDNYDVFLCQGIGVREWRFSTRNIPTDTAASDDLVLLQEFAGDESPTARTGDVLYLPPGVAHWGTAQRACMSYSIGMRAPSGYRDPDLQIDEVKPGYISQAALRRAGTNAETLGCEVTELKEWLRPLAPTDEEVKRFLQDSGAAPPLHLHGMARLAFDDSKLYLNGKRCSLNPDDRAVVENLCRHRRLTRTAYAALSREALAWLIRHGAFELPGNH